MIFCEVKTDQVRYNLLLMMTQNLGIPEGKEAGLIDKEHLDSNVLSFYMPNTT
jgi:hypothetical protein